jgi:hypothetical protein
VAEAVTVVSVLCPTRERPEQLLGSLKGLLDLAADPDAVEIMTAADHDDTTLPWEALPPQVRVVTFGQRHGYPHLEAYYNTLAGLAKGEWLLVWNDDATMETPHWDQIIRDSPPGFLWAAPCNPAAEPWMPSEFPVIPAAWYRHLGWLSWHHSVDMWMARTALATGTGIRIPVSIVHNVAYERRTAGYPSFHTPAMEAARQADAERLRELLR